MGHNCKYNGGNNQNPNVAKFLQNKEVIEICPELLAGMPVPRACAEIVNGRIVESNGRDVDGDYRRAVALALEQIKDEEIDLVILQSRSPTCGVKHIYDGSFTGTIMEGQGIFAKALLEMGYMVMDSEEF